MSEDRELTEQMAQMWRERERTWMRLLRQRVEWEMLRGELGFLARRQNWRTAPRRR